jgi:hypothetical protein
VIANNEDDDDSDDDNDNSENNDDDEQPVHELVGGCGQDPLLQVALLPELLSYASRHLPTNRLLDYLSQDTTILLYKKAKKIRLSHLVPHPIINDISMILV